MSYLFGHIVIQSGLINPGVKRMAEEELKLWQQMERAGSSASEQAHLISKHTGHLWTAEQMQYLSEREKECVSKLTADATSADHLVDLFQSR